MLLPCSSCPIVGEYCISWLLIHYTCIRCTMQSTAVLVSRWLLRQLSKHIWALIGWSIWSIVMKGKTNGTNTLLHVTTEKGTRHRWIRLRVDSNDSPVSLSYCYIKCACSTHISYPHSFYEAASCTTKLYAMPCSRHLDRCWFVHMIWVCSYSVWSDHGFWPWVISVSLVWTLLIPFSLKLVSS